MRTHCQQGGELCLLTSAATGALLSSPPAWAAPVLAGACCDPCGGVLRGLLAAGDSIVPDVASFPQQELGMPMACSIPILPGSGVDQPALLEAVVCAIWLTSSPGPQGPVR